MSNFIKQVARMSSRLDAIKNRRKEIEEIFSSMDKAEEVRILIGVPGTFKVVTENNSTLSFAVRRELSHQLASLDNEEAKIAQALRSACETK